MDDLLWLVRNNIFVLLTRLCKLLFVVNVGMLCGAAGGKVRGQTAGDWW